MRYQSTRHTGEAAPVTFSHALRQGLAPDGGLYIPLELPKVAVSETPLSIAEDAARILAPFFAGDPLESELGAICKEAFNFPCPLVAVGDGSNEVLELFHGPTAAFKDFGARFLAACSARIPSGPEERSDVPRTILVATSGDTGGAVASAFATSSGARAFILFPEGRVSPRQEAQLTAQGDAVTAFAVKGTFDDCQRIVKEAFGRQDLRSQLRLTSANSINVGRLLPQAAYWWHASSQHFRQRGTPVKAVIPTGNLGHGVAAVWARAVGAPIDTITLALNANRAVLDVLEHGHADPRLAIPTLANAMDVGVPSNLERLLSFFGTPEELRAGLDAYSFDDEEIRTGIVATKARYGYLPCPHTACAFLAMDVKGGDGYTLAATAHPAKFETIVEPLVREQVPLPPSLAELLSRPQRKQVIEPTLEAFERELSRLA